MATPSAGTRFMTAFNDIEDHFRTTLGANSHVEFIQLARDYAHRARLTRPQRDALAAFAALRNAISHGRYYDGRPIAEPVDEVVAQIEHLRDQIKKPPTALGVLGAMQVRTVGPSDPISTALGFVQQFDYSQLPVYAADRAYVGLLTTNSIARWLADQLTTTGGLAEAESISRVLRFAEPREVALLVPRTITATDALHRLAHGGRDGNSVTALIITQTGSPKEQPLAVVVADDIPSLSAALTLA